MWAKVNLIPIFLLNSANLIFSILLFVWVDVYLSFKVQYFLFVSPLFIWALFITSQISKWTLTIYTSQPFQPTADSSIIEPIIADSLTSQPTTVDSFKKSKQQVTSQNIHYSPIDSTSHSNVPATISKSHQISLPRCTSQPKATRYHSQDAHHNPKPHHNPITCSVKKYVPATVSSNSNLQAVKKLLPVEA